MAQVEDMFLEVFAFKGFEGSDFFNRVSGLETGCFQFMGEGDLGVGDGGDNGVFGSGFTVEDEMVPGGQALGREYEMSLSPVLAE